ncbi:LysR family transcriptional regulator substrate-binding protein [Microcella daejeonensis]|uniref:LysR family transcriptional regulator substrate-binding protein n=1 Tax=Microcella daejeonensis TaxID=2994971 RepID=A0A9E8MMI1_9MICO|nr:LysR family transcriptional regulator substrate-binding protein [Microcella daejeonensis]WAB81436.1 LysR family transcriptional regulator substrate-binding protein [Microcella daejeonensis]
MPDPLAVAFVTGVTPGKWQRIWRDRRPRGRLDLAPMTQAAALAALEAGTVHMVLARDVAADDDRHAIPLYREAPVVVAPKGSLVAGLDSVTLDELHSLDDVTVQPIDLENGTGEDAVALVAANVGVCVMPQSVARVLSRKDVVARPLVGAPDTGISLVWPAVGAHPLCDEFIGIVRGRTANSSR